MPRRRIIDDPTSRLAVWALRVAAFALAATALIVIIVRVGFLEVEPAMVALGGSLATAVLAILLAFGAMGAVWFHGVRGLKLALLAMLIGFALLTYPAYLGTLALRYPAINDITTDTADPPRFEVLAQLRPRGTAAYGGAPVAAVQRASFPDIASLSVSAPPQLAFEAVNAVIAQHKWRIVADRTPQAGRRDGQIEAVARSPVLGFRDDLAVRIRATSDGALIDLRSASRYGSHDFGMNAARIRGLLEEIDAAVTARADRAAREPRPAPLPVPAAKPAPAARR